jgi:hypothetical protein
LASFLQHWLSWGTNSLLIFEGDSSVKYREGDWPHLGPFTLIDSANPGPWQKCVFLHFFSCSWQECHKCHKCHFLTLTSLLYTHMWGRIYHEFIICL